jgi:ubiquinone/menaquinone biosynthesis C-methylase UbiE
MTTSKYDSIAGDYDRTRGGLERGSAFAEAITAQLPDVDGPILDIGVGTGALALPLTEQSSRAVLGFDLSEPMLVHSSQRLPGRVARADASALPVASGVASAAVLCWIIHVLADVEPVMREVHRALRPGGKAFVIEGDAVNTDEIAEIYQRVASAAGRLSSDARIARALDGARAAGLELEVQIETTGQPFEQSPADMADNLRRRLSGFLVDLDDVTFAAVVQPGINELMALPEPERKRIRRGIHYCYVLTLASAPSLARPTRLPGRRDPA